MPRPNGTDAARRLRRQLPAARSGPRIITASDAPDGEGFYGWQVLALESRLPGSASSESRSVYANLGDPQQPQQDIGVLRAVHVDNRAMRAAGLYGPGEARAIRLPTRFVWAELGDVRRWIDAFTGIVMAVGEGAVNANDAGVAYRSLRIDLAWHAQVFEKRWQSRDGKHADLNHQWEMVWSQIGNVLETAPQITNLTIVHEGWLLPEEPTSIEYDLSTYRVGLLSSP